MLERQPQQACPVCGTPASIGCECPSPGLELSKETLGKLNNLEVEVKADFGAILDAMRQETGADLQPRPEGFHITVISPPELKALRKTNELSDDDATELQDISREIQSGQGVDVTGIGYVDGSDSPYQMRDVDTSKKTAFIALDIPRLAAFREKVGLPPKDFHVTLGFEGGDIHFHVVGEEPVKPGSPKMKEIKAPIPKKADENFREISDSLPDISFGSLDGKIKEEKKKKPGAKKEKKERVQKEYDGEKLRTLLTELVTQGNSGGITADHIDRIVEVATTDSNSLGRELRADFRFVKPLLAQCEK